MLEALLSASSDQAFNAALRDHGPVREGEISALRTASEAWSSKRRKNAIRALSLSDTPGALAILRELAAETDDLAEWALAMRTLLDEDGAEALAASRPEIVTRALGDSDPLVRGVGLQAALLAGREDAITSLEAELSRADRGNNAALAESIRLIHPGPFEARLAAIYEREPDSVLADALVTALSKGQDPATGALIRARYEQQRPTDRAKTLNLLRAGTAPWARAMLLEIAGQERPDRTAAITALAASGPAADWLQICVRIFSETPPREPFTQRWADYNLYQEPCEEAISALAGEKLRDDAACSWAKGWLASHAPQP